MERKYFARVSDENDGTDRIHGSSVVAVEAALAFSSSNTISWSSVVLRRSFCVLVVPGRADDLAAYPRFLPLGLRAGHKRPRPLEAVQFSLHQLTDR